MATKQVYMIFYDRGYRANDNAEYLYRWIRDNHKEIKIAYILNKSSESEWIRLENDGFNLLNLDLKESVNKELKLADYVCSSIFNETVELDFTGCRCKRVFLNHGCFLVPINYIKQQAQNISLFIAANQVEADNLLSPYHGLQKCQVALCGQPRQDYLIEQQLKPHKEDSILIQFWQRPKSWTNNNNEKFLNSDFFKKTRQLLKNKTLYQYCKKHKLKVIFKMHSIQYDWLHYYKDCENDVVKISPLTESFEDVFVKSKMIVTDISSNAYEMAKVNKPCIYYEPDPEFLFGWRYKKNGGYELNLPDNGIGPVIYNSAFDAVNSIIELLDNNCVLDNEYIKRRSEQISFINDSDNCKRCFEAIMNCKSMDEILNREVKVPEEKRYARSELNHWMTMVEKKKRNSYTKPITSEPSKDLAMLMENINWMKKRKSKTD